jgi:hypothetical protein
MSERVVVLVEEAFPKDLPLIEVSALAVQLPAGVTGFQRFTCAGCGRRNTMPNPNTLFRKGGCDACGHVTNLEDAGCGLTLVAGSPGAAATVARVLEASKPPN